MEEHLSQDSKEKELKRLADAKLSPSLLEEIATGVLSTASTKPILLKQSGDSSFLQRSQINLLVVQPFGTGKSTLLNSLPEKHTVQLIAVTEPGLVGSIGRNGEVVPSIASICGGKTLIIDEYHNLKPSARIAMLSLLSDGKYSKQIGYGLQGTRKTVNRKYYKLKVKENKWEIRTTFSCICAGLEKFTRKLNDQAWLSRFLPIVIEDVKLTDVRGMMLGKKTIHPRKIEYNQEEVFDDYVPFVEKYFEKIEESPVFKNFPERQTGFTGRLCASMVNWYLFKRAAYGITDYEETLKHVPLFLYNFKSSNLEAIDYIIRDCYFAGYSQDEIADKIDHTQPTVSKHVDKLKRIGLLP